MIGVPDEVSVHRLKWQVRRPPVTGPVLAVVHLVAAHPAIIWLVRRRGARRPCAPAFNTGSRPVCDDADMRFDTKIVIAVRGDLPVWQKLNVTAFLASGVAGGIPELLGKPYEDGSGNRYLEMFRQPVLVYTGDGEAIGRAHRRALERNLPAAVYTQELFATGNDDDNRAAVREVSAHDMRLAGLAVYGPRNVVDKVVKGLALHP
jgi:hypothetical protein